MTTELDEADDRTVDPRAVRVGTCGWNYPTGAGTWNGIFYPTPQERRRGPRFDELSYYAEHFNTVEVNSTFYRPPDPRIARTWANRTPAGFDFSLKVFHKFTHAKGVGPDAVKASRGSTDDAAAIPQVSAADIDEFRHSIDPVASAGKVAALLAQFPPSFKNTERTRDYVSSLLRAFADYPVAVELRHRSWSDALRPTLELLNSFRAAWVQIDEPKFRFSIRQNYLPNVTGFYYMRLHGRNAAKWWRHDKSEDRYDYLYSPEELRPFAETARAVSELVKKAYVYFNNHFAAKAVVDGVVMKQQLGQPITGEYRTAFVERYPIVKDVLPAAAPPTAVLQPKLLE